MMQRHVFPCTCVDLIIRIWKGMLANFAAVADNPSCWEYSAQTLLEIGTLTLSKTMPWYFRVHYVHRYSQRDYAVEDLLVSKRWDGKMPSTTNRSEARHVFIVQPDFSFLVKAPDCRCTTCKALIEHLKIFEWETSRFALKFFLSETRVHKFAKRRVLMESKNCRSSRYAVLSELSYCLTLTEIRYFRSTSC